MFRISARRATCRWGPWRVKWCARPFRRCPRPISLRWCAGRKRRTSLPWWSPPWSTECLWRQSKNLLVTWIVNKSRRFILVSFMFVSHGALQDGQLVPKCKTSSAKLSEPASSADSENLKTQWSKQFLAYTAIIYLQVLLLRQFAWVLLRRYQPSGLALCFLRNGFPTGQGQLLVRLDSLYNCCLMDHPKPKTSFKQLNKSRIIICKLLTIVKGFFRFFVSTKRWMKTSICSADSGSIALRAGWSCSRPAITRPRIPSTLVISESKQVPQEILELGTKLPTSFFRLRWNLEIKFRYFYGGIIWFYDLSV